MSQEINYLLFSMLRALFSGNELSETDKAQATAEMLDRVMTLAVKHDIAHLIALSILNNGLAKNEDKARLEKYVLQAFYRCEIQTYEFKKICEVLEKAEIPFIPLKGSVLRDYYPEPWWRTSCDIDILVESKNLQKAIDALIENLKYTEGKHNSHDITLSSKNGVCLELHFYLGEEGRAKFAIETLKNVWDYTVLKNGHSYWLKMSDEMFYYYHIAHMAEHFETGGCGIRPFIDLWILDNLITKDTNKRDNLLNDGNLFKFADRCRCLSKIWFCGDRHNTITGAMEEFVISGGVYGSIENNVRVQQTKSGNKFQFIMSKIFLPTAYIERMYPTVKGKSWLLPFMQVRRWISVVMGGVSPRTKEELKMNQEIHYTQLEQMQAFMENIGL